MKMSLTGLNDDASVQSRGSSGTARPASSSPVRTMEEARSRWFRLEVSISPSLTLVLAADPEVADLRLGDQKDEHEEDEARRRGEAEIEPFEPFPLHVVGDAQGRLAGSAVSQDVGLFEDLRGSDQDDHRHEGGHRPQQRQGDVPEEAPGAGAVELGRLV